MSRKDVQIPALEPRRFPLRRLASDDFDMSITISLPPRGHAMTTPASRDRTVIRAEVDPFLTGFRRLHRDCHFFFPRVHEA
jgi:hypothetical protein